MNSWVGWTHGFDEPTSGMNSCMGWMNPRVWWTRGLDEPASWMKTWVEWTRGFDEPTSGMNSWVGWTLRFDELVGWMNQRVWWTSGLYFIFIFFILNCKAKQLFPIYFTIIPTIWIVCFLDQYQFTANRKIDSRSEYPESSAIHWTLQRVLSSFACFPGISKVHAPNFMIKWGFRNQKQNPRRTLHELTVSSFSDSRPADYLR